MAQSERNTNPQRRQGNVGQGGAAQGGATQRSARPSNAASDTQRKAPPSQSAQRQRRPASASRQDRPSPSPKGTMTEGRDAELSEGSVFSSLIKAMIYIVLVIIASVFLAYFIIVSVNDIFAFVKSDADIEITIPEGADIDEVTDILKENGIIEYPYLFRFYSDLIEHDGNFLPGKYTVSPSMNYDFLLSAFRPSFSKETIWLTIPEGYCVEDIINLFTANGVSTREEFIKAINETEYDFEFLKPLYENRPEGRTYLLEGYLYPDKYEFYVDSSAETVIYKLLDNFERKFDELYYERAEDLGLTVDEILTIASLIQSEAYYLDEYEYVSSVFHNRLNTPYSYPKLESDATIVYAIYCATGTRPSSSSLSSQKFFESPYNTYLCNGLPPGPICSPSYNAITCALYPADSKYYFFVSDSSGRMTFSKTLSEHLAAINNLD